MDDFTGLLTRDFGLKPQGKSAPMASSSPSSDFSDLFSTKKKPDPSPSPLVFDDMNRRGGAGGGGGDDDDLLFNDVFTRSSNSNTKTKPSSSSASDFDYDAMFKSQKPASASSMPVFDKPVYDDEELYETIPELNDDIFSSPLKPTKHNNKSVSEKGSSVFDDLIPGFGRTTSPPNKRSTSETIQSPKPSYQTAKASSNYVEDPFVVLEESASTLKEPSSSGVFTDPFEEVGVFNRRKPDHSSVRGGVFVDVDSLENRGRAHPDMNSRDKSHLRPGSVSGSQSPIESSRSYHPKKVSFDEFSEPQNTSHKTVPQTASPVYENPPVFKENVAENNKSFNSDGSFDSSDDVWLTVSEIPLFTQPTSAPPPSRPPPPRPTRPIKKKVEKVNDPSSSSSTDHLHVPTSARPSADELDDFAMGRNQSAANGYPEPPSCEDDDVFSTAVSSAAAMKDAMDKAEAKFRHAKERREKENLKASRSREGDQMENHDSRERELREKQASLDRERVEREKAQEREREEREREKKERERLLARQAVERATREARERAATEAHAKAQRAAVGKATDARERAERAAVQRANAEARERAAAGAREKAEKAAAEARRERANADVREKEAKLREERAAVERAAAEARGRAAAQAKARQQENNNDLDSFFNSVSRPSSAPRQRTNPPDPFQDSWNKGGSFGSSKASSQVPSENLRKTSSATNFADDLSSIFGASSTQSGGFQDVEGETEDRRRARLERHQRTQERAAKALAEKNERDLNVQREQAERNRIGETLDVEIKRWGAGKEGNLRALLSTLQYVLWPECGWQAVSLTDLITAASVKKFYRKATLCIHPDKVQQKGANLQQKYIAEKVFDLLKEAWNKFNSEELF
ncbi:unnamed protein product [Cochlearia groenlandica]